MFIYISWRKVTKPFVYFTNITSTCARYTHSVCSTYGNTFTESHEWTTESMNIFFKLYNYLLVVKYSTSPHIWNNTSLYWHECRHVIMSPWLMKRVSFTRWRLQRTFLINYTFTLGTFCQHIIRQLYVSISVNWNECYRDVVVSTIA